MRWPRSLQGRLALGIGIAISTLWVGAALIAARDLRHEIDEVFDTALAETAQRLLPLAVLEITDRDDEGISQQIESIRPFEEIFSYIVRDAQGRVLLRSRSAENVNFPPYQVIGFRDTATHRLYYDSALGGAITITMAEPRHHRDTVSREAQIALALPLTALIPLSLAVIFFLVRLSLRPIVRFRTSLAIRGAGDLSPVPSRDLPSEIRPVAQTLNQLLGRLRKAFEAERSFAANAAHELRTPVAAALAQAQRLIAETSDTGAARRAGDIEASLKRLNRMSEKLIQLARAEGGRLRTGQPRDIRPVLEMVAADFDGLAHSHVVDLGLPPAPVMTDIDPDALAILFRNLVENALKHGHGSKVEVRLGPNGTMRVSNEGPVIAPEEMKRLSTRFARGATKSTGSGLGLSIVRAIVDGAQGTLTLNSPATGRISGFEAVVGLP